MWVYLKIIGPEGGQPPDLYPLHHGISAWEIGGGGGVLTTTPSTRSYSGGDRPFCVAESSKSGGYRLRSPIAPIHPNGESLPCNRITPGWKDYTPFPSRRSLQPPRAAHLTPLHQSPVQITPATTKDDDRHSKRASTREIGPTTNRVPDPHHGNAHTYTHCRGNPPAKTNATTPSASLGNTVRRTQQRQPLAQVGRITVRRREYVRCQVG